MYIEYYTIVSASSGFWERLLMKQIGDDLSCRIGIAGIGELKIISKNGPALDEIILLSKEYPDEVFQVEIAADNIYENYVYHYECSSGQSKLIKQGFEYCFGINAYDRNRLPNGLFEKFRKTASDIYKRLEERNTPNAKSDPIHVSDKSAGSIQSIISKEKNQNSEKDLLPKEDILDNITVLVKYETPKVCITCRKLGLTFIDVRVEFSEKVKKTNVENEFGNAFDDCSF